MNRNLVQRVAASLVSSGSLTLAQNDDPKTDGAALLAAIDAAPRDERRDLLVRLIAEYQGDDKELVRASGEEMIAADDPQEF
jgi:hypothetical protein